MIGIYAAHAQSFLLVLGIITTLAFALPLFFAPLKWARLMLFKVPEDIDLNVYFGRCLGAFILVVEMMIFRGAFDPAITRITFDILFAVFGIMLVVHLYGWLKEIQPVTENLENIMWAVLLVLAALFYPLT
ncbi:MAG: hypothetical protein WA793_08750 [Sphingorhabdus sp.]|uniref:hypothetical protein n=1 Tax=Sphingorhabdus sp. TaxID=1902408 RepID=UPI003CC11463